MKTATKPASATIPEELLDQLGFLRRDDLPQAAARDFAEDILSLHG